MSSAPASRSAERLLDAEEIENLLTQENLISRPTVKAHLEALAQKIRRDASALKRLEDSQSTSQQNDVNDVNVEESESQPAESGSQSVDVEQPSPEPTTTPAPVATPVAAAPISNTISNTNGAKKYKSIDKFSFDAGSYNSPTVTIYITIPNLTPSSIPDPASQISCTFTPTSFDLTVSDCDGVHYRLVNRNLANEINPDKSKHVLKLHKSSNQILVKLAKCKTDYGSYDTWNELSDTKSGIGSGLGKAGKNKSKDPTAGIMDLMKDMYDKGDDKMKKMIGETMLKQREGKLNGDTGMGGMGGGMGDMDF